MKELNSLVEWLKGVKKKIIVIGGQRSGTTIATRILAHELAYPYIAEESIKTDDLNAYKRLCDTFDSFVLQCPALSHLAHLMECDFVCYVNRDFNDIRLSVARIQWGYNQKETEKIKPYIIEHLYNGKEEEFIAKPSWELKSEFWHLYQISQLKEKFYNLWYPSMFQEHMFFINQELRKEFEPRQTIIYPK